MSPPPSYSPCLGRYPPTVYWTGAKSTDTSMILVAFECK